MEENELKAKGFEQIVMLQSELQNLGSQMQTLMNLLGKLSDAVSAPENSTAENVINLAIERLNSQDNSKTAD